MVSVLIELSSTVFAEGLKHPFGRGQILNQTHGLNTGFSPDFDVKASSTHVVPKELINILQSQQLFRGLGIEVTRQFLNAAFTFAYKDSYQSLLTSHENFPPGSRSHNIRLFLNRILAAALGGMTTRLIFHPIDVISTQQMANFSKQGIGSWKLFKNIITIDGFRGVYRGLQVSLTGIGLFQAFLEACFNSVSSSFWNSAGKAKRFFVAQFFIITSRMITYPFDTVRRKLMVQAGLQQKSYQGAIHCCKDILEKKGFLGLYEGVQMSIYRLMVDSLMIVLVRELVDALNSPRQLKKVRKA